jgi:hypothetical protein
MMTCPFDDVFNTSEGHIFNAMNCVFVGIEKMKIYIYIYIYIYKRRRRSKEKTKLAWQNERSYTWD